MLESVALHEVVPKLHCINLLLLQNSSYEDGLHVKICAFYLINGFDSRGGINLFNLCPNAAFYIFLE
jgi:hypothetical protein